MLGLRFATGFMLIALFLGAIYFDTRFAPWFPFWLVMVCAAMLTSAWEIVGLLAETPARPSTGTVMGGSLAMVLANWAPHVLMPRGEGYMTGGVEWGSPVHALVWPLWVFVGVLMAAFLGAGVQFDRPGRSSAKIAGTVLATAYIALLGSFIIQHRWLPDPPSAGLADGSTGVVPLILLVATCKGADTGAYAIGRIAGRRKLWPALSPNKTVEGAIGGLIFAIAAAVGTVLLLRLTLRIEGMPLLATAGYGLAVGIAAQLGDLMESLVKRDCAKKDSSDALPGFGGVLDVVDSLLFGAPVAYAYWLVWGP
jgi:phosphatidate cytidylyltransferase